MDIENIKLKPGTSVKVLWVDGEEIEGTFVAKERGYIVLKSSGSVQACLPAHLEKIEILYTGENNDC